MRRLALLPILLVFACGDDKPGPDVSDTDTADTIQPDATDTIDDTADTDVTPSLTGCLLAPDDLPRPPGDTLPCGFIPPGLTL